MKFGAYHMDTVFLIMAAAFIAAIIYTGNFAFVGAVIICVIFGLKKTAPVTEEENSTE
ncbi:hypothetical protein [Neisseria sp. CCUG12390]|uniref:hypothetical protein n=1 Tax=Neisseria sp. CCUG12390 TaxID=3392035 RepID=UPI003A100E92